MTKDAEQFRSSFAHACVRGDAPFCSDACPFHYDVRDFIAKIGRGSVRAAYKTFQQAVVFPDLVSRLCDARCKDVCPGKETDASVRLRDLERAVTSLSGSPAPVKYNLPAKTQRVAVVGAGPCGLAFAIRLSAKKYPVTVFERTDRRGGSFLALLPAERVETEIALQSTAGAYETVYGQEILSLDALSGFDAIFVATGQDGSDFGLRTGGNPAIHAGARDGIFFGGQLTGLDLMSSIRDGAQASVDVENYLKLGSTRFEPVPFSHTGLVPPENVSFVNPVEPSDGNLYTKDEAMAEAERCLRCDCDRCFLSCDFMQYHKKYPSQLATAVEYGLRLDVIEPNTNNRMVNACADCGLCKAVCPYGIDTGHQLQLARHQMFEQAQVPDAYHEYLLRDMAHASCNTAFLSRPVPEGNTTRFLFFPGCQLSASDSAYTVKGYELLLQAHPETGVLLACCGAPAFWAGDEALHEQTLCRIREAWEAYGHPVFVLACPSCGKHFRRFLPEIEWVTLWSMLSGSLLPDTGIQTADSTTDATDMLPLRFALADPCAAKDDPRWRTDIEALLHKTGTDYILLAEHVRDAKCCGYGGDIEGALPVLKEDMANRRITESALPYLCYCANCRDIYANRGKEAIHVMDLFLETPSGKQTADLTQRRRNREACAREIRLRFYHEAGNLTEPENSHILLLIDDAVRQMMNDARLTEDELRQIISHAEETGLWLEDETGLRIAHLYVGAITAWVEYRMNNDRHEIIRVYRHRVAIDENGRPLVRSTKRLPHYVRS